jgi:hypothetical protein
MLALAAAPAIVRADSLMRVTPIDRLILWGDGVHDDAAALQALIDGRAVVRRDGAEFRRKTDGTIFLRAGTYAVGSTIVLAGGGHFITDCHFKAIGNPSSLLLVTP